VKGRKPLPNNVKALRGNPGHRPFRAEPEAKKGKLPPVPPWLDPIAKTEFKRIRGDLVDTGVLTVLDWSILAAYCAAFARWRRASAVIVKHGTTYKTCTAEGYPIIRKRPEVSIVKDAETAMRMFAGELGLSPSSRTRVKFDPPADDQAGDAFRKFLSGA
jgi:P27 family predicted phage terminase small subunit